MNAVSRYVGSLVEGLYEGGVREAIVCPGSRSTPLVLAFSRMEGIRIWVLYDERSAGFFALGIAKASSAPVALISTSGTAAANFLPAIAEAKLSRVPLVAITADRPPEMRDFGGAQTIDQVRIYGSHTKWFQDMPIAASEPSLFRYSRLVGARASHIASGAPAGPVHINFPFREPLFAGSHDWSDGAERETVSITRVQNSPHSEDVRGLVGGITEGSRGIIVAGPGGYDGLHEELSNLSRTLGWPILADSLSNLRPDGSINGLIRSYEFLLRNKAFRGSHTPEWVIRVGKTPTSKELNAFCEGVRTILLDDGCTEWNDPDFDGSRMVYGDLQVSISIITETMKDFNCPPGWLTSWAGADREAMKNVDSFMEEVTEPFEGKLLHRLSKILKPRSPLTVVVGNSMPLRDLDYFFLDGSRNIRFLANRGANGIDGLVSTALGVSALEGDVLLILGDIAFYHDMNGLLPCRLYGLNATILIVNNRGGGIFSFLPQSSLPKKKFETLFGMPHDLDFSGAKTIYGGDFQRVTTWPAFDTAINDALEINTKGLKIIEFTAMDRDSNLLLHRRAFEEISSNVGS